MDWLSTSNIYHYGHENAHDLQALDDLRVEDPILHCLVTGTRTAQRIAARMTWPHAEVLLMLREYKKQNRVYDIEGQRSVEWHLTECEDELLQLQSWVRAQVQPGGLFGRINRNDD